MLCALYLLYLLVDFHQTYMLMVGEGVREGCQGGGGDFLFSRTIPVVIFYDSFFMIS